MSIHFMISLDAKFRSEQLVFLLESCAKVFMQLSILLPNGLYLKAPNVFLHSPREFFKYD